MNRRFELRLSDKQIESLKQIANAEERSISALIRVLINERIKQQESIPILSRQ